MCIVLYRYIFFTTVFRPVGFPGCAGLKALPRTFSGAEILLVARARGVATALCPCCSTERGDVKRSEVYAQCHNNVRLPIWLKLKLEIIGKTVLCRAVKMRSFAMAAHVAAVP